MIAINRTIEMLPNRLKFNLDAFVKKHTIDSRLVPYMTVSENHVLVINLNDAMDQNGWVPLSITGRSYLPVDGFKNKAGDLYTPQNRPKSDAATTGVSPQQIIFARNTVSAGLETLPAYHVFVETNEGGINPHFGITCFVYPEEDTPNQIGVEVSSNWGSSCVVPGGNFTQDTANTIMAFLKSMNFPIEHTVRVRYRTKAERQNSGSRSTRLNPAPGLKRMLNDTNAGSPSLLVSDLEYAAPF